MGQQINGGPGPLSVNFRIFRSRVAHSSRFWLEWGLQQSADVHSSVSSVTDHLPTFASPSPP